MIQFRTVRNAVHKIGLEVTVCHILFPASLKNGSWETNLQVVQDHPACISSMIVQSVKN
jgi:hypothetical protein